jgi:signal peptidase I
VPGDTVRYGACNIVVTTAAGQKLTDAEPTMACREWSGLKQVVIPDGMYFVAGDNRGNSLDSRIFGPVSKSQIHAKVLAQMRFTWGR